MNSSPTLGLWELGLKLYGWLSSLENNWLFHKIGETAFITGFPLLLIYISSRFLLLRIFPLAFYLTSLHRYDTLACFFACLDCRN